MGGVTISEARLRQLSDLLTRVAIEGASGLSYHPCQLIGEGGQGWVYRAGYDEPDGPWVVVKILRPDVVNEEALTRFLREADVLRKLGQTQTPSPNVVRFYDHGICRYRMPDGESYALPFTVLEFVHGQTLGDILAQTPHRGLPVARVRRLFRQVARALSLIHGAQIVHRDLKPSNLLIATEATQEVVKVTDFGLVKRFDVDARGTLALAGASIGYAPPEQFEMGNRRVSPRTDLFSFASVLFEALTGVHAFPCHKGETPFQVLSRVLSGPRPQLAGHAEALPFELAERRDLVHLIDREMDRATRSDPGERHESILEFWGPVEAALRMATERTSQGTARIPVHEGPSRSAAPPPLALPSHPPAASATAGASIAPGASVAPPTGDPIPTRESAPNRGLSAPPHTAAPAAGPAAPSFSLRSRALLPDRAWAMAFEADGRRALALGRFGLLRNDAGVWSANLLPSALDPLQLRGVLATPQGALVYGERGQLWGQGPDGVFVPWSAPDPELIWSNAVLVPHPAEILLVGEQADQQAAVLGLLRPGQPMIRRVLEGTQRLSSATRLTSGGLLVCGEGGELLLVGNGPPEPIPWGRTGHLCAILPTPDGGAHVIGSGGHALLITAGREARLEPVQTTRDLYTLAMAQTPWAGGQDARLLRRTPSGWVRIPLPSPLQASIRALHASATTLSVLLEDGQIVEGSLA